MGNVLLEYMQGVAAANSPTYGRMLLQAYEQQARQAQAEAMHSQMGHILQPIQSLQTLSPEHQALIEVMRRAGESNIPAFAEKTPDLLGNMQDRSMTAIAPTNLVKNLQAMGVDPKSDIGQSLMYDVLVKPQTQINMGTAKPMPPDWAGKVYDSRSGEPIDINPTQSLEEAQQQYGGALRFKNPEPKMPELKDVPPNMLSQYMSNKTFLADAERALEALDKSPNAVGAEYAPAKALAADKAEGINSALDEHLKGLPPEQIAKNRELRLLLGGIRANQIYEMSGKTITANELQQLGFVPDFTQQPDVAKAALKQLVNKLRATQGEYQKTFNGKHYYNINELADNVLPSRTAPDGTNEFYLDGAWVKDTTPNTPNTTTTISTPPAKRKVVKQAKDASGQEWVLYDDGTEEKVNAK